MGIESKIDDVEISISVYNAKLFETKTKSNIRPDSFNCSPNCSSITFHDKDVLSFLGRGVDKNDRFSLVINGKEINMKQSLDDSGVFYFISKNARDTKKEKNKFINAIFRSDEYAVEKIADVFSIAKTNNN